MRSWRACWHEVAIIENALLVPAVATSLLGLHISISLMVTNLAVLAREAAIFRVEWSNASSRGAKGHI